MADVIHLSCNRKAIAPARRADAPGPMLHRWRARAVLRRMLRDELLPQPDSVLADAGWSREAAKREAAKPFWRR